MKTEGKALTAVEIMDIMVRENPTINKQTVKNSIPGTLSVAGKEGRIKRTKNEDGEWEYDLPEADTNHSLNGSTVIAVAGYG